MADVFQHQSPQLDSPASDGFQIVANNTTVFTQPTRYIYVGVGGNLGVQMSNKLQTNTNLVLAVQTGAMLQLRTQMVFAANTTANGLVGFW